MTERKARELASALGGEVERIMPQSRMPGVRLKLADGRVSMIDEHGGETFKSDADMSAYTIDGDHRAHVVESAEWMNWGVSEPWATKLACLIGGEAYQSGGNIWIVHYARPDGRFVVVGDDGADIYQSEEHYEGYYDKSWPEPEYAVWND
jgi:hypothetical protein